MVNDFTVLQYQAHGTWYFTIHYIALDKIINTLKPFRIICRALGPGGKRKEECNKQE
jgi:hypothetical protein